MIGNTVDEDKRNEFEKQLSKIVVEDGEERKQAIVSGIPFNGSSSNNAVMSSQYMQKFIAQISVGELDVVVLDKGMFESFVKQDIFLALDSISQLDLDSMKDEKIEASGSSNNMAVYGINAKDVKLFKTWDLIQAIR